MSIRCGHVQHRFGPDMAIEQEIKIGQATPAQNSFLGVCQQDTGKYIH